MFGAEGVTLMTQAPGSQAAGAQEFLVAESAPVLEQIVTTTGNPTMVGSMAPVTTLVPGSTTIAALPQAEQRLSVVSAALPGGYTVQQAQPVTTQGVFVPAQADPLATVTAGVPPWGQTAVAPTVTTQGAFMEPVATAMAPTGFAPVGYAATTVAHGGYPAGACAVEPTYMSGQSVPTTFMPQAMPAQMEPVATAGAAYPIASVGLPVGTMQMEPVATAGTAYPIASVGLPVGTVQMEPVATAGAVYPVSSVAMPVPTAVPMGSTVSAPTVGSTILAPTIGSTVLAPRSSGSMAIAPGVVSGPIAAVPGGLSMFGGLLKAGSITDDVFNMVDRNQDGVISRSEFRGALKGNIINASPTTRTVLGRA